MFRLWWKCVQMKVSGRAGEKKRAGQSKQCQILCHLHHHHHNYHHQHHYHQEVHKVRSFTILIYIFLDALASLKPILFSEWVSPFFRIADNLRIHQRKWDRIVPISWASVLVLSVPSVPVPVPSCQYHQYQYKYHQYQLQYIQNIEVNMRFWHHQ